MDHSEGGRSFPYSPTTRASSGAMSTSWLSVRIAASRLPALRCTCAWATAPSKLTGSLSILSTGVSSSDGFVAADPEVSVPRVAHAPSENARPVIAPKFVAVRCMFEVLQPNPAPLREGRHSPVHRCLPSGSRKDGADTVKKALSACNLKMKFLVKRRFCPILAAIELFTFTP